MRIVCETFSLPKGEREFSDYEDACFPYDADSPNPYMYYREQLAQCDLYRTAVCDGATDSCFSKYWAELLAQDYGLGKFQDDLSAAAIADAQETWKEYVRGQELPWYAEEKAKLGAFAALVGLTIVDEGKRFCAVALGDCCLFHVRAGQLGDAFPIAKSSDFDNFPYLLGSLPERNAGVFDRVKIKGDGQWQSGDVFLLMSDAIACWYLKSVEEEKGRECLNLLMNLVDHDNFERLVRLKRNRAQADGLPLMRDDDVTLVRLKVTAGQALPVVPQAAAVQDKKPAPLKTEDAKEKADNINVRPEVG